MNGARSPSDSQSVQLSNGGSSTPGPCPVRISVNVFVRGVDGPTSEVHGVVRQNLRGVRNLDTRLMRHLRRCTSGKCPIMIIGCEDEHDVFVTINRMDEEFNFYQPIVYGAHHQTMDFCEVVLDLFAPRDGSHPLVLYGSDDKGAYFDLQNVCEWIRYDGQPDVEYKRTRAMRKVRIHVREASRT